MIQPVCFLHRRTVVLSVFILVAFCSRTFGDCVQAVETVRADARASPVGVEEHGLKINWSGAASVSIDNGATSLLIDPFVSREENTVLDILFRRKATVAENLIDTRLQRPEIARARTILVGHTHYDHSLDVPYFAACTKAKVIASPSTERILQKAGYSNVKIVQPDDKLGKNEVDGQFKVSVIQGLHGAPPLGIDLLDPTVRLNFPSSPSVNEYAKGEVYTFFIEHASGSVLHIGTAGIVAGSLDHLNGKVDVVMLSLVGRGKTGPFLENVIGAVNPRYVIPIHYDNLFRPLTSPMRVTKLARLGEFLTAMEEDYPDVEIRQLDFDEVWKLPREM